MTCHEWTPERWLLPSKNDKYAVVVLNQVLPDSDFIINLLKGATVRVSVDGGSNELYKLLRNVKAEDAKQLVPHLITGDFDSIQKDVMDFFKKEGSSVIHTPDQNATDFTKSLRELHRYLIERGTSVDWVLCLVSNSGRLDHTLSNINTLFKTQELIPNVDVIMYGSDTLSWMLASGCHSIRIPKEELVNRWCGLVPVGKPVDDIATTGLKWNLNHQSMAYGSLISTSNEYGSSECVTVASDGPLLWIMGVRL